MIAIIIFLALCYIGLYFLSLKLKDNSIVDIFWGLGFVGIAWIGLLTKGTYLLPQVLVTLLVTVWGIRLAVNIFSKKIPYHGEDRRYALWRKQWKYFKTRSFFQVFVLQGILMLAIALPIILINNASGFDTSIFLTMFGGLIALFGLLYEDRADGELAGFMKNKKPGDILTSGLRVFHRYPQYFGESVFWLGISFITFQVSLWGFLGFIIIFILVRFISGVPMLEKRYEGNKNYEVYSQKTPLFFPNYSQIFTKK